MLVKDILKQSATLLGKDAVLSYIDTSFRTGSNDAKANCSAMLNVLNLVMHEIATNYIPLTSELVTYSTSGSAYFVSFPHTPLEILGVYDSNYTPLEYSVRSDFIRIPTNTRYIRYTHLSSNYTYTDSIGYSDDEMAISTIVYGVCAEYCIYENRFSEAVLWNDKFVKALQKAMEDKEKKDSPIKNKKIKGRKFL